MSIHDYDPDTGAPRGYQAWHTPVSEPVVIDEEWITVDEVKMKLTAESDTEGLTREQAADWIHSNIRPAACGEQPGLEQSDLEDILDYAVVNGVSYVGNYLLRWTEKDGYSFRDRI